MKKSELIKILSEAIAEGKDIQIEVTIPGQNDTEYIVNKNKSIANKLQYYCDTYDENLVHNKNPNVKIVGVQKIKNYALQDYEFQTAVSSKIVECEHCGQSFNVSSNEEREYGEFGLPYIICPCCNQKCYLEDEKALDITPKNLKFPDYFTQFGVSEGAVHIGDEYIEEWTKKALDYLLKNPDSHFYHTGTGDSMVIGLQYDDEIDIVVAKNYYEYTHTKEEFYSD